MTETLLCVNPGPSTLVVISLGMTRGQGAGIVAACGVLAANAVYFGLSATGLVAVHTISAGAFLVIRWMGAAYLIWLGSRIVGWAGYQSNRIVVKNTRAIKAFRPLITSSLSRSLFSL